MALQITRCPVCRSTFHTNTRLVAADSATASSRPGSGKVRCGACLNLFEASSHLVETAAMDAADGEPGSVFVSEEPEDYIDPRRFLTAGAFPQSDPKAGNEGEDDARESAPASALDTVLVEDESALEPAAEEDLASLARLDAPIELSTARQPRGGRRLAAGLAVLALGGLLVGQYLWFERAVFSQVERLRPFYEYACERFGCELPPWSDIGAIRSDRIDVRSHPQHANGLLVNLIFRNTSAFPQAFPVLILTFSTVDNEIVAMREFAASEYLDAAPQPAGLMPVMTPVQVTLEIIDPGADATSYTVSFRSP